MMDGRRTASSEERQQTEAINKTLKVSSYLDEVFESIHTGAPPKVNVPNFKEPTKGEVMAAAHSDTPLPYEAEGLSMNFDELYKLGGVSDIPDSAESQFAAPRAPTAPAANRPTCTQNQWRAIRKYPGLVEFLGQSQGEKVARQISEQVNVILAEVIEKNSREANEHAILCEADRQNLKQYFQTDDWICRVTASGPFSGEDAIFYSREQDVACVLRKSGSSDGPVKYADISSRFNIIFEVSMVKKQADTESMEKTDEEVTEVSDSTTVDSD